MHVSILLRKEEDEAIMAKHLLIEKKKKTSLTRFHIANQFLKKY